MTEFGQWQPRSRRMPRAAVRAWPPTPEGWRRIGIVALVLAGHVLLLIGLTVAMRPPPQQRPGDHFIEVRLLESEPSPPAARGLPTLTVRAPSVTAGPTLPQRSAPRRAGARVVNPRPAAAAPERASPAAAAHLYDAKGRVLLATPASVAAAVPRFRVARPKGSPKVLGHESPIQYRPTVFSKYWAPRDENALQALIRKTTVEGKVLKLPGGYSVKCAIAPLALMGGCGIAAPEQLSAPLRVKHRRDDLAPAAPLIKPPPAASVAKPAVAASVAGPAPPSTVAPATSAAAALRR